MRLLPTPLTGHLEMVEAIEEIHEGTVGLAELLLPYSERLHTVGIVLSLGRWPKDPHLHLLGSRLVENIQNTEVEFVAVVAHLLLEFLKGPEGVDPNTVVEFPPEIGGANILALPTLLQKLNHIGEGLEQALLCFADRVRAPLEEGSETLLFANPGNLLTMAKSLNDCVSVTGCAHVYKSSHLCVAHADKIL